MTTKQIGDVVGIDRLDEIDRQKLDPRIKLQLLAAEAKEKYGRDPRAGGLVFVARPRVLLQLLIDLNVGPFSTEIRLHKPIVIGVADADLIGTWQDVPIVARSIVVDDKLYVVRREELPPSSGIDRQRAGQLRVHAHAGRLLMLREEGN